MGHSAWFESWDSLFKIFVSASLGYLILIFYVRLAGKRSSAKMNNFDWIVTVAVGSIFGSMVLLKDVTVADGAFSIGLLLGFHYFFNLGYGPLEMGKEVICGLADRAIRS